MATTHRNSPIRKALTEGTAEWLEMSPRELKKLGPEGVAARISERGELPDILAVLLPDPIELVPYAYAVPETTIAETPFEYADALYTGIVEGEVVMPIFRMRGSTVFCRESALWEAAQIADAHPMTDAQRVA